MKLKELRAKLNDLDWADEDEIIVYCPDNEMQFSIDSVFDFSSMTTSPKGEVSYSSLKNE